MLPRIDPLWSRERIRGTAVVCQFNPTHYRIFRNRRLLLSYESRSRRAAEKQSSTTDP